MNMRHCDLMEVLNKVVIGGQYICFKHDDDRTKFVRCMDFGASFAEFTKDNPAMSDSRFLPKVQRIVPMMRQCVDGKERIVLIVELTMKTTMVWHCTNCVETGVDPYRPIENDNL